MKKGGGISRSDAESRDRMEGMWRMSLGCGVGVGAKCKGGHHPSVCLSVPCLSPL